MTIVNHNIQDGNKIKKIKIKLEKVMEKALFVENSRKVKAFYSILQ